jgi:hypothetical protein
MIRVKDNYKNEYGVLRVAAPENLGFDCCEHIDRCPYLTGLVIETASYKYDHLIKRFLKRVVGKQESIHNVRPAREFGVDLFYSRDPFNYGEQLFEIIHQELGNLEKRDFCEHRARDFNHDLMELRECENEVGVVFGKYSPVAAFIFPFCEYLPTQRNPGVVSIEDEAGAMPNVELFSGWISAVQTYFNGSFRIPFRNLTYQSPNQCICIHSSRRNTLFGVIGARTGEGGLHALRIEKEIEKFADRDGASDELCAIFDKLGIWYESPEEAAGTLVQGMYLELRDSLNSFWERIGEI